MTILNRFAESIVCSRYHFSLFKVCFRYYAHLSQAYYRVKLARHCFTLFEISLFVSYSLQQDILQGVQTFHCRHFENLIFSTCDWLTKFISNI